MHRKHNTTEGFTLAEVMIAIAIIGILTAIAIPAILSWLPGIRLKAAARDVYSSMQRARSEAIRESLNVTLTFTSGAPPGPTCTGGSYTFTNASRPIAAGVMTNGVCISTPGAFPSAFSTTGSSLGATGTILLTHPDSDRTYTITQTVAGSIRLQ